MSSFHLTSCSHPLLRRLLAVLACGALATASAVQADVLDWDPGSEPGLQYADGVWSTSAANWSKGGTAVAWTNGIHTASFSSAAGATSIASVTLTLAEDITLEQLGMGGGYGADVIVVGNGHSLNFTGGSQLVSNNSTSRVLRVEAEIKGGNLMKMNQGRVVFAQNNSYTGTTTINAGTLQLGNLNAAGTLGAGDVIFNGGATLANLSFLRTDAYTLSNNIVINADGGAGLQNFGNPVTVSGVISGGGAGGLNKGGSGIIRLTGNNTYTGPTSVNNGTLLINGDQSAATGAVTVGAGHTLGGTGTIGGAVTVNGTLAAGDLGVGTLTTRSLTLGAASTFEAELGRSGDALAFDSVRVVGTVNLAAGANLKLALPSGYAAPEAGDIIYLVQNDGDDAVAGVFTKLNGVDADLGEGSVFEWNAQSWQITYRADFGVGATGGNDIALIALPEPSAMGLLGAGATMLAHRGSRRNR